MSLSLLTCTALAMTGPTAGLAVARLTVAGLTVAGPTVGLDSAQGAPSILATRPSSKAVPPTWSAGPLDW